MIIRSTVDHHQMQTHGGMPPTQTPSPHPKPPVQKFYNWSIWSMAIWHTQLPLAYKKFFILKFLSTKEYLSTSITHQGIPLFHFSLHPMVKQPHIQKREESRQKYQCRKYEDISHSGVHIVKKSQIEYKFYRKKFSFHYCYLFVLFSS